MGALAMMGVVLVLNGSCLVQERPGVVLVLGGCCLILGQCQGVVLLLVLGRATLVLMWYDGVVLRMGRGSLVIVQRRGCCWCGAELIWCWRGDEECVLGGSCQALGM